MSNDVVIRFFEGRPFIPFRLATVDGRAFDVKHPEQAMFGLRGETVLLIHSDRTLEIIESRLIVSMATLEPANFDTYGE